MNLVLDEADEINTKKKTKKSVGINFFVEYFNDHQGRILLKGDNITLMMRVAE